jgi:hypothetical protein
LIPRRVRLMLFANSSLRTANSERYFRLGCRPLKIWIYSVVAEA